MSVRLLLVAAAIDIVAAGGGSSDDEPTGNLLSGMKARLPGLPSGEEWVQAVDRTSSDEEWVQAVDADKTSGVQTRVADGTMGIAFGQGPENSGCGIHFDCFGCTGQRGCSWLPGAGCIPGFDGFTQCSVLLGEDNFAKTCGQYNECDDCTEQNGCVWASGECTYSRGTGCLNDPLNCANYKWQCSDKTDSEDDNPSKIDKLLNLALGQNIDPLIAQYLGINQWANSNDANGDFQQSILCPPLDPYCSAVELDPYNPANLATIQDMLGIPHQQNAWTLNGHNQNQQAQSTANPSRGSRRPMRGSSSPVRGSGATQVHVQNNHVVATTSVRPPQTHQYAAQYVPGQSAALDAAFAAGQQDAIQQFANGVRQPASQSSNSLNYQPVYVNHNNNNNHNLNNNDPYNNHNNNNLQWQQQQQQYQQYQQYQQQQAQQQFLDQQWSNDAGHAPPRVIGNPWLTDASIGIDLDNLLGR